MADTSVTPKDIWDELQAQGASSIQAAGIMGNWIAESSLDPETHVVDSNGYESYGLAQWNTAPGNYPQAATLVTGDPAKDLKAQVKFFAETGGFKAATGDTPALVASNVADRYERCKTCTPGGSSTEQREGYAAEVAGWASGGSWPQSAGSATDTATLDTSAAKAASAHCAWQIGGGTLDLVVYHQSLPSLCILSKSQARALVSTGIFGGGIFLALFALSALFAVKVGPKIGGIVSKVGAAGVIP